MAKKTIRKRKIGKTAKNESILADFLTFPKMTIYAFFILAILTIYLITRPTV